jgi:hypothetical protein
VAVPITLDRSLLQRLQIIVAEIDCVSAQPGVNLVGQRSRPAREQWSFLDQVRQEAFE